MGQGSPHGKTVVVPTEATGPVDPSVKAENFRVKTTKELVYGDYVTGVVGKIGKDEMALVEFVKNGETKEHRVLPIDVLRNGEILVRTTPRRAYRWGDVKAGDTIEVRISQDRIDKEMYCQEISIIRRPRGKLPVSQKEEKDAEFARLTILNDIDNGEDVSDEAIAKAFPSRPESRDPKGQLIWKAIVGGLNAEYQKKLDAIRDKAKKEKDLKATPPDKK